MTQAGIELVRAERRRRWTRAEKERLVAASFEPGVSTSDVARRAGLHVSQLFRWRKLLCERVGAPTPALVPVVITPHVRRDDGRACVERTTAAVAPAE